jgi:hypothetical protein
MTALNNKYQGLEVSVPNAQYTVPASLKFATPKYGPFGSRKEFRLPPASSTYSTSSDRTIRFYFPDDGLVDFRRGYLSFNVTITKTGGTYARLAQGCWSMFDRLRLIAGAELEDIHEYNLMHSLLFEMLHDDEVQDTIGPSTYGYDTQANRNANGAVTTTYAMPLMAGLFLSGVVPMGALDDRLCLELYLDDPTTFVETDGTNPVVTLTGIYFHYEILAMSDDFAAAVKSTAVNSGLCYPFRTFTHYVTPVTSMQQDISIPHKSAGIDCIVNVMRNSTTLNTTTVNDKFLTYIPSNIQQFQLRINNEYYPLEPVFCNGDPQPYVTYLRWANLWRLGGIYMNSPAIDFATFSSERFLIVNNLELYPNEGVVNPVATTGGASSLYLRLTLGTGQPAVPTQLDSFVQHYKYIELRGYKLK